MVLVGVAGLVVTLFIGLIMGYFIVKNLGIDLKTVKASMLPGLIEQLPGAMADPSTPVTDWTVDSVMEVNSILFGCLAGSLILIAVV